MMQEWKRYELSSLVDQTILGESVCPLRLRSLPCFTYYTLHSTCKIEIYTHKKKVSSKLGSSVFSLRSDFCLNESFFPSVLVKYSLTKGSARPLASIGGRFLHSNTVINMRTLVSIHFMCTIQRVQWKLHVIYNIIITPNL